MDQPVPSDDLLARVIDCIAEVLGTPPHELARTTPLAALPLESFTAVRLRLRIRERTGRDLPLTALLGNGATARAVADRLLAGHLPEKVTDPEPLGAEGRAGAEPGGARNGEETEEGCFPLTPIQASYLAEIGRASCRERV